MRTVRYTLLLLAGVSLSACMINFAGSAGPVSTDSDSSRGVGLLYTNVVVPLDVNMNETPIGKRKGRSELTRVVEPLTGAQVSVEIDSIAIADAARKAGLTKVYYADIQIKEILFGIFQQRTVLVYGE